MNDDRRFDGRLLGHLNPSVRHELPVGEFWDIEGFGSPVEETLLRFLEKWSIQSGDELLEILAEIKIQLEIEGHHDPGQLMGERDGYSRKFTGKNRV